MDYITRYLPSGYSFFQYNKYKELLDEILHLILEKDFILEINTSGYKNGGTMPNPCGEILYQFYAMGGRNIIFGSDAHDISRVGKDFYRAEKLAREAGFKGYFSISDHNRSFHSF